MTAPIPNFDLGDIVLVSAYYAKENPPHFVTGGDSTFLDEPEVGEVFSYNMTNGGWWVRLESGKEVYVMFWGMVKGNLFEYLIKKAIRSA